eukprot:636229-Prorocentrum_lima.AAC.1
MDLITARRSGAVQPDDEDLRRSVSVVRFAPELGERAENPLALAQEERELVRRWDESQLELAKAQ